MAVRALIDLNPVPFAGDQIVAALGALHVVRLTLRFSGGLLRRFALLAQQLGVAPGEILVFVLARFLGTHLPPVVEDGGGCGGGGGGVTCSCSPPGFANGTFPGGEDDSPE